MEYIRTKDGIYKAAEIKGMIVARGGVAYSCDIADVHFPIVFKEKDIAKQSDTIEELCDEFVSVYDKYHDHWDNLKECLQLCWDGGAEIYGAIWTDKGLIYVAKMNEKGELELL